MDSHFSNSDPENLWNNLLSREPNRILQVYSTLTEEERSAVVAHLKHMTEEAGWHPEQLRSALVALETLGKAPGGAKPTSPDADSTNH